MDYVIRVTSLRSNSVICEHAFEASSKKEAAIKLEEFAIHTKFKNKDISFSLWGRSANSFVFEKI